MRLEDWPKRLNETIEAYRNTPFQWGEHDCILFAARCTEAVTGRDPCKAYRNTYRTAHAALRLVKKMGGFEGIMRGSEKIPVLMAQRGDIVQIQQGRQPAMGVCLGKLCAFAGPSGLVFIPLSECIQAWHV